MNSMNLKDLLGPEGPISQNMPGYEHRLQQIKVAIAIQNALKTKRHCLAEAGTGVGKSMAYIIPAAEHALNGNKVIISSHTLYLQAQLMNKDIPFVQNAIPQMPFTAVIMKGRSNYLCLNNLDAETPQLLLTRDPFFERIREWAKETQTGDVAELDFAFSEWEEICSDQDTCHRQECRFFHKCFYYKARKAASEADIVITNHSLFFSDLAIRMTDPNAGVLPDYKVVIFDEAHHLEDVATKVFGIEFSNWRIPSFLNKIRRTKGISLDPKRIQTIEKLNQELFGIFVNYQKQEFFFEDIYHEQSQDEIENIVSVLTTMLDGLNRELSEQETEGRQELEDRLNGLKRMCTRISEELKLLFFGTEDGYFKWGEKASNGKLATCYLRYSPLSVADLLYNSLWKQVDTAVLTSATLSNSGRFDYIKARLGIPDCVEIIEDSPFDFRNQSLLYIPKHLDFPSESPEYADKVADEIERIVRASGGRAFLLFTSYRMMNAVYERLLTRLPYVLLKQGDMPNEQLVQEFLRLNNACLFGVHSFWEGVDIRGEALSCVVIDKLPFGVPDNPLNRARINSIKAAGRDWFREYAIPQAQIRLKQGFGRLIRKKDDRGVVAILDSRLVKKHYGKEFLQYLPPSPITHSIEDVEAFFAKVIGRRA